MRTRVWKRGLWAAALAAALLPELAAQAQQPLVVVSAKSANELLDDARHIFIAGGVPQLAPLVDGLINQYTQGRGLAGVDRDRPLGAYAVMGAPGAAPDIVVFVPISDSKQFLELLRIFFTEVKEQDDGRFLIRNQGMQFHGKFAGTYCFLSMLPSALERLADPDQIASKDYDITLTADLSQVPADLKQAFINQIQVAAEAQRANLPKPESAAEARGRELGERLALQLMRTLVQDTERVGIGFTLDRKSSAIVLETKLIAAPDTAMAKALANYGKQKTAFAALPQDDDAISFLATVPVSETAREPFRFIVDSAVKELRSTIDESEKLNADQKRAAHRIVDRVVKVARATGDTGLWDGALVVRTSPQGKMQVQAACALAKGNELSVALEELLKLAPNSEAARRVTMDVAKKGQARIHKIDLDVSDDPEAQRLLGETPTLHVAISDNRLFLALGGDSLAAVTDAIEKKPAGQQQQRPPLWLHIKPSKVLTLIDPEQEDPDLATARQAFRDVGDYITLEAVPMERGVRCRLELGGGFLRWIATEVAKQLGAAQ